MKKLIKACIDGYSSKITSFIANEKYVPSEYRDVYKAILHLESRNEPITESTINYTLKKEYSLQPRVIEMESYLIGEISILCSDVIEDYFRSEYVLVASQMQGASINGIFDFNRFRNKMDKINSEYENFLGSLEQESFNDIKERVVETIRQKNLCINKKGILTGIEALDRLLGELEGGSTNIVAARPGMGKTAFAIQLAFNLSILNKKAGALFFLEMKNDQVMRRVLANKTHFSNFELRNGLNTDRQAFSRFYNSSLELEGEKMIMIDSEFDVDRICAKIKAEKLKNDIEYVIIDYIGLITCSLQGTTNDKVSYISRKLKIASMVNDIPIIILSQLSRSVETRGGDKRPMLSDLRDSGSIEQDASTVSFLLRHEYYQILVDTDGSSLENVLDIIVAKNREGTTGTARTSCDIATSRIFEYNKEKLNF